MKTVICGQNLQLKLLLQTRLPNTSDILFKWWKRKVDSHKLGVAPGHGQTCHEFYRKIIMTVN